MGAKRLLLVVVVLGVAATIGLGVFNAAAGNHENLVQINNQLVSDLNQFSDTMSSCETVSCSEQANVELSQQLGSFESSLQSAPGAGVSQQTIASMIAAAQNTETVTETLSEAGSSPFAYRSLVDRLQADQSLTRLVDEQRRFVQAVNATGFGGAPAIRRREGSAGAPAARRPPRVRRGFRCSRRRRPRCRYGR